MLEVLSLPELDSVVLNDMEDVGVATFVNVGDPDAEGEIDTLPL